MKVIALSVPKKQDETFHVYLGNGSHHVFKSERDVKAFIARTNKFLTQELFEANLLYTEIFSIYRQYWLLLDNSRKTKKAATYQDDRHCTEYLNNINEVLNRTLFVDDGKDGAVLVFVNFKKVSTYLQKIIHVLRNHAEKRGSTIDLYNFNNLLNRLIRFDNELDNYGKLECFDLFDVSTRKINERITLKTAI
jgi:hypothetical protein